MIDVAALNKACPKYPVSCYDKGWAYGVWYCGTAWDKVKLYGQYPPTFLKRALALFPTARTVLHAPSGTLFNLPEGHITFDAKECAVRKPMVIGDCAHLPFKDNTFDLVISDPPYSEADSKIYGCDKKFPQTKFLAESHRVLKNGGCLGFLHYHYPSYRRRNWELIGLFAVVTGFQRKTRMFSVLKTKKELFS